MSARYPLARPRLHIRQTLIRDSKLTEKQLVRRRGDRWKRDIRSHLDAKLCRYRRIRRIKSATTTTTAFQRGCGNVPRPVNYVNLFCSHFHRPMTPRECEPSFHLESATTRNFHARRNRRENKRGDGPAHNLEIRTSRSTYAPACVPATRWSRAILASANARARRSYVEFARAQRCAPLRTNEEMTREKNP